MAPPSSINATHHEPFHWTNGGRLMPKPRASVSSTRSSSKPHLLSTVRNNLDRTLVRTWQKKLGSNQDDIPTANKRGFQLSTGKLRQATMKLHKLRLQHVRSQPRVPDFPIAVPTNCLCISSNHQYLQML